MADVVITTYITNVEFRVWLKSSLVGMSKTSDSGLPMIDKYELGPDQEVIFNEYLKESAIDVLKLFTSRQGDVTGTPYERSSSTVIYRFNENIPVLKQASALKQEMDKDVESAIYSRIAILWFTSKGLDSVAEYFMGKFEKLSRDIERNLYLLHD